MSKIIINKYTGPHSSYNEVGQTNPLRWVVLFKHEDGSFTEQTKPFKCKDFFNEVLAYRKGHELGCYGFTAAPVKINETGIWNRLYNIANQDAFEYNIGSINKYAQKSGMPELDVIRNGNEEILFIPMAYFENTYFASLITYLIRVANVEQKVDDFAGQHPTRSIDSPFETHYDKVLSGGFKLPVEGFTGYYYVGPKGNYDVKPPVMHVHNCGCRQWWDCHLAGKEVLGY